MENLINEEKLSSIKEQNTNNQSFEDSQVSENLARNKEREIEEGILKDYWHTYGIITEI
jgi:hypothetical protein